MKSADFVDLLVQLGVMLLAGAGLGYAMRRLKQPSVVGEMAAGILLGVTVLGSLAPGVYEWIFPDSEAVTTGRDAIIKIGTMLFLYVAGSEVDLSDIKTLGRRSLIIGVVGTTLPIAIGVAAVYASPVSLWGESVGIDRLPFALFIGMNMANSANPVLARILIDLGMMKSRIATVMMTATIVDDLINWTLYAIILGSITTAGSSGSDRSLPVDLLLVALLFVVVLVGVRWLAPHAVGWGRKHMAWPTGYIAIAGVALLAVAAASEAIGVQAFLGAFLVGVAFSGVASGQGAQGHKAFTAVAIGFFAPLFFVTMALNTDFVEAFDPALVLLVIAVALGGKLVSVLLGVRAAGLPIGREAWAMAWGLNARGATGIILAATGRQAGIISDEVFVALVVMAIVTSIIAGPAMVRALGPVAVAEARGETEADDTLADVDDDGARAAYGARIADRDLSEAERAALGDGVLFRVLVAIDDPATAEPLVRVAADLAASQQPAEVVLASFEKQDAATKGAFHILDAIASELDSLRGLEEIVQARGLTAQSTSQRSTDLVADIVAHAEQVSAHALVVGDRRDDPDWVATVDGLIASNPADIYVVVAPRPRADAPERTGPPVVEAGEGLPGQAAMEAGVRFALAGTEGPVFVGLAGKARSLRPYREVLDRLGPLGRPGRIEEAGLDTIEGAAVADDARLVVRPFSAPEGLEPIERARPDAERFGCPLVLVAPDPARAERSSLAALLDEAESALPTPSID